MFEKATRMKLRFNYRGQCTTEDLWDIPLTDLDEMYREFKREQRGTEEESLLQETRKDEVLTCKISILHHIITTKLEELRERSVAKEKRERKKHLLDIIADKQDANLRELSVDELTKLVDSL